MRKNTTPIIIVVTIILGIGFIVGVSYFAAKKSPEELAFEQAVEEASLEGKVEEFEVEGRDHVEPGTQVEGYKTNPPTSGTHWTEAQTWGTYENEVPDGAAVHGLEHGGIWISYKGISDETLSLLREIQEDNKGSVILSPRETNDSSVVISSWGKMMKLTEKETAKAIIQKYINTYKNDSPEKLAR
ncbi:MAG TPA: DUF3105 domain-containing protein [Candidatus Woesebacteria bacterium]|nr:DUF3105 domain-containing protein [Candidatus Woesebacteria bacterium]